MTKNQNDVMNHFKKKREEESIASAKITKESEKYEVEVVTNPKIHKDPYFGLFGCRRCQGG